MADFNAKGMAAERASRATTILFDLDGTLIDSVELILASFRHASEAVLGERRPDEVLLKDVGMPLAKQMEIIAPGRGEEMVRSYREHNNLHHDELLKEYPGTREALDELKRRGVRMGIVTSKSRPVAKRGIERFDYGGYMEAVVASDDVEVHKPDAYPILHAAELMGEDPACIMYVGDSPHDMSAAIAAGVVSVAALWGAFPAERVLEPGPDFAIDHLADVLALLDGDGERFIVSR